jgi:serine protease Do
MTPIPALPRGAARRAAAALLVPLAAASACTQGSARENDVHQSALERDLAPPPIVRPAAVVQDSVTASRRTAIVTASERVAPAVVSVNVRRRERVQPRSFFEQLLLPPGAEQETAGLGSGFVIRRDGLVLTNEHVVRGATQVLVTLADGREFDADLLGTDEVNDLALLRLRLSPSEPALPVAPLGDSGDLMTGEWVVAIGNPFGYLLSNSEPSVSAGVISAVGRNLIPQGGQRAYSLDMIQTDASINPGNSGGPLVNALGQVVGVNSSILSSTGGSEGLGFAIPINRARRIALDLADDGKVRRAWTGAQLEQDAATPGGGRGRTVRVARVVPGSPAERAGMREGMTVVSLGRKRVRSPLDWEAALLDARVGETLEARVADDRGGERVLRLVTGDVPSVSAARIQALRDFQLVTLTPAIQSERGLASEQGALIVSLSEAARATGLQEGDLLLQVNRLRITSAEDAAAALQAGRGSGVVVYYERNGRLGSTQFYIGGE